MNFLFIILITLAFSVFCISLVLFLDWLFKEKVQVFVSEKIGEVVLNE